MRPRTTENSCLAQENPRNLAGLLAERSGGGFASSPDVPASALGPRIIDSLHAGCRVERETSGLARIIHGPGLGTACHDERPPRYERFRREPSVGFPLEPFGNDEFFRSTLPARDDNERAGNPPGSFFGSEPHDQPIAAC